MIVFNSGVRRVCLAALWQAGLLEYDRRKSIQWEWQAMDGGITKAPLGGEDTAPNPTDRGKSGTKRCLLTDARGAPLALNVAGANRHDIKLTAATLDSLILPRPQPTPKAPQHLSLDKGFDYQEVREVLEARQYIEHIGCRGEEVQAKRDIPGYRTRRWVVECSHSWMNRFRRILIRWEKKTANYQAMLELASAFICFRTVGIFG